MMKKIMEVILSGIGGVILTLIVQYFFPNNDKLTITINGQEATVTENEYEDLIGDNLNLKEEIKELNSQMDELKMVNTALKGEKKSISEMPVVLYKNVGAIVDEENIINIEKNAIAIIDDKKYISENMFQKILNKSIDYTDENIVVGNSTKEEIKDLLEAVPPYQIDSDYFTGVFPNNTFPSVVMSGKKYAKGIVFNNASAYFNLEGKYKTLKFSIGHIDDYKLYEKKLIVYLDNIPTEEFMLDPNSLPVEYEIDLNYCNQLRIEVQEPTLYGDVKALYACVNMLVK